MTQETLTTADRILALAQAEMPLANSYTTRGTGLDNDAKMEQTTVPCFAELREWHTTLRNSGRRTTCPENCSFNCGGLGWLAVSQEKAGTVLRKLESFNEVKQFPKGTYCSYFGPGNYAVAPDPDEATIAAAYQWAVSKGWIIER